MLLASPVIAGPMIDVDPIFARWSSPASPGCAVAVSRDGKTLLDRAFGAADLEHGVANRPSTVFEAGSVSKQFVAAAILLLAEGGKLKLSDDVRTYVPELPDYGQTITIDHLLSHTSGLRDWGSVMSLAGWPRMTRIYTPADVLDIIVRQKRLNYRPGTEYSYTNSGYNLMALIVERVSGRPLAAFTAERLFEPLGMRSTSWRDQFRRIVPGRAIAYQMGAAGYEQAMPFEDAYGNGGLLTTTGDLLRWNDALTSGALGPFVTAELQRRAALADGTPITYARGLFVDQYRGENQVSHSGATGGYRAWLGRLPGKRLSIALLCNADDVDSSRLAHQVLDRFLGVPAPAPAVTASADERAGLFADERSGELLRLVSDKGTLRLNGRAPLEVGEDGQLHARAGELAFDGPDRFVLHTPEGQKVGFRRVQSWSPPATELSALAGRYVSDEAGAALVAAMEGDRLVLRLERRPGIELALSPAYSDVFQIEEGIVRVIRDDEGKATALGFGISRVRDLRFQRDGGSR
jgi:CubicO group peptidase (beta-lactamase class C family)